MKREEIERKFSDYINSREDAMEDIELDNLLKTRIWTKIEKETTRSFKIGTFWWAAASIIGIIVIISLNMLKEKNNEIARLESELVIQGIAKNTILSQVSQMQHKLELAQSNIPKIDTIYKTHIIYKRLNAKDNSVTASDPIAINTDSINKHFEKQVQSTAGLIKINNESPISDSLKINELNNLNKVLANSVQFSDSTNEIIHFRIDFGEMKFDNNNSERSWKLIMTYL